MSPFSARMFEEYAVIMEMINGTLRSENADVTAGWTRQAYASADRRTNANNYIQSNANLRFAGPETMETKIFGRLTAWQNWIFQRPNAVGPAGALQRFGTGSRPVLKYTGEASHSKIISLSSSAQDVTIRGLTFAVSALPFPFGSHAPGPPAKSRPPDEDVISKPNCTSPMVSLPIQPLVSLIHFRIGGPNSRLVL